MYLLEHVFYQRKEMSVPTWYILYNVGDFETDVFETNLPESLPCIS